MEAGERCDDGNNLNNDGCSYRCRIEPKIEPSQEEKLPPVLNEVEKEDEITDLENIQNQEEEGLREVAPELETAKATLNLLEILFLIGLWIFLISDLDFKEEKKRKKKNLSFFKSK